MATDLTLLTTRAECDEVLESLEGELDTYQQRDSNLQYQDRQSGRTAAYVAGRLAGVDAEIASHTATLAQPDLPGTLRKLTQSKLRRANNRKDNLLERGQARGGVAAFLASVDAEQNAAQVAVLTAVCDAVARHRDTLLA